MVAVTGTNGKSSIVIFYYQILNFNSKKVASIGTIGVKYKDKKDFNEYNVRPNQVKQFTQRFKKRKQSM